MTPARDPGPVVVDKILDDLEQAKWSPADVARQARRVRAHIAALRVAANRAKVEVGRLAALLPRGGCDGKDDGADAGLGDQEAGVRGTTVEGFVPGVRPAAGPMPRQRDSDQ